MLKNLHYFNGKKDSSVYVTKKYKKKVFVESDGVQL